MEQCLRHEVMLPNTFYLFRISLLPEIVKCARQVWVPSKTQSYDRDYLGQATSQAHYPQIVSKLTNSQTHRRGNEARVPSSYIIGFGAMKWAKRTPEAAYGCLALLWLHIEMTMIAL